MIRASLLLIALTFAVGPACKGKEGGGKAESKGPTKLPKLGLEVDAPGGPEVGDAIMGEGHMLQGSGIGAMTVEVAEKPQTMEEAKSDADMYSPKNLKAEKLADGWLVTFDNKGSMGANFFVTVQREIAGKTYKCTTTGSDAGQAAAVVAACKSLRKGA